MKSVVVILAFALLFHACEGIDRSDWSAVSVQAGGSSTASNHREDLAFILVNRRENGGLPCLSCGGKRVKAVYKSAAPQRKVRFVCEDKKCKGGGKRFGILSGAMLVAGLQIPMHFALIAAFEFGKGGDGKSATQAAVLLGISQDTAFTVYQRIGRLMKEGNGAILGDFAPASAVKIKPPKSWLRFLHAMVVERKSISAQELHNKVRYTHRTTRIHAVWQLWALRVVAGLGGRPGAGRGL